MLRWFPRLQVATACFSCSTTDLKTLISCFILTYMHNNHCQRATAKLQLIKYYYIYNIMLTARSGSIIPLFTHKAMWVNGRINFRINKDGRQFDEPVALAVYRLKRRLAGSHSRYARFRKAKICCFYRKKIVQSAATEFSRLFSALRWQQDKRRYWRCIFIHYVSFLT